MKILKLFVFLPLFFAGMSVSVMGQTQKEHKKTSYVDSLNRYYQHPDLPVYIFISTSPDASNASMLEEVNTKDKKPIYLDGPGLHNLKHMDAIHQKIDVFHIYADDKAPVTTLNTNDVPKYKNKIGKLYFGKGLVLTLSAKDDMVGVKQIYVSINRADYKEYNSSINITEQGDYIISYYSVDNVGNAEKPKTFEFTLDLNSPKTYHNIIGIASGQVISSSTRIYLDKSDSLSDIATTYYAFDDEPEKLLTGKEIQFKHLENGDHILHYRSVDNVKNEEAKQEFSFFYDKIAPVASMDILGDKFIVGDKIYFSGRTKVKLTAIDNRTGIKELKYSINNSIFQDYDEPFYMPSKAGLYTITYYAIDGADNRRDDEALHSRGVIYVDLSGPVLTCKFEGPTFKKGKTLFVGPSTKVNIVGKDNESGLQYLTYSINKGEEQRYSEPFNIGKSNGEYEIMCAGYDNVNNRNQEVMNVKLDVDGPIIAARFSTEPDEKSDKKVYPSYVKLFMSATDAETTSEIITYSINGGAETLYKTALNGFEPNKTYHIKIKARDALNNETEKEITFHTEDY